MNYGAGQRPEKPVCQINDLRKTSHIHWTVKSFFTLDHIHLNFQADSEPDIISIPSCLFTAGTDNLFINSFRPRIIMWGNVWITLNYKQVKELHSLSVNYVLVRKSSYLHWINNLFKIICFVRLTDLLIWPGFKPVIKWKTVSWNLSNKQGQFS